MPSFDVVSELDKHEVTNAVENAVKELDRRYDLKGKGSFEFKEKELTVNLTAEADFQLEAMIEILKLSLVKRKIDAQCLEIKDAYASLTDGEVWRSRDRTWAVAPAVPTLLR